VSRLIRVGHEGMDGALWMAHWSRLPTARSGLGRATLTANVTIPSIFRLCHYLTFASLTSATDILEALTTQVHGRILVLLKTTTRYLRMESGCGLTRHTQYNHYTNSYKQPECDLPENDVFNNHVSIIRIRSEHPIGFLKGWFPSLKNLRVVIRDGNGHKVATYWVAGCVAIHSFAMQCEADERSDDESDAAMQDPFIMEGLSSDSDSDSIYPPTECTRIAGTHLQGGKAHRQWLKERHFHAKTRRAERRAS